MKNTYRKNKKFENPCAAEPVAIYEAKRDIHVSGQNPSRLKEIMATTVSVDDYFDELISLVRADYASL